MLNNSGINHNEWQNLFQKIDYNCDLYDIKLKEIDTININIGVYSTSLNLINKEGKILKEIKYLDAVIPEFIKKEKDKQTKTPKEVIRIKRLTIKKRDSLKTILNERFDREILLEFLKINKKKLNEYLKDCNYSEYFSKKASDYQVYEALLECEINNDLLNKYTKKRN